MREIRYDISDTIKRVENLRGIELTLSVNKGRNKFFNYDGVVENLYRSIFTVRPLDDTIPLQTYSYSDVLTKNIKFFPAKNHIDE